MLSIDDVIFLFDDLTHCAEHTPSSAKHVLSSAEHPHSPAKHAHSSAEHPHSPAKHVLSSAEHTPSAAEHAHSSCYFIKRNTFISGVLNKRNLKKGIASLLPNPALTYCFVSSYSHNPFTLSCGGKKLFGSYQDSGTNSAPRKGKRIWPP